MAFTPDMATQGKVVSKVAGSEHTDAATQKVAAKTAFAPKLLNSEQLSAEHKKLVTIKGYSNEAASKIIAKQQAAAKQLLAAKSTMPHPT